MSKFVKNSIVISLDNDYFLTNNFIENLLTNISYENGHEIIVVSDGCKNIETILYLNSVQQKFPFFHFYELQQKRGYSVANNYAVSKASGEILTFLNSDVFPQKESIDILVGYIENGLVDVVQGLLVFPQTGKVQSTGHLFIESMAPHVYQGKKANDPLVLQEGRRQALTTAFLSMKKSTFLQYKGFDECYYNAYEGRELTLKINKAGGRCLYTPKALAYHCMGGTRKFISKNESQQKGIFWSRWASKVEYDLKDYLRPQLTVEMQTHSYFLINCSYLNGWNDILQGLNISVSDSLEIKDRFGTSINLYYNLPYSMLTYNGPYLFLTNKIDEIRGNWNWIKLRNNPLDFAMDIHGNIERLSDLI